MSLNKNERYYKIVDVMKKSKNVDLSSFLEIKLSLELSQEINRQIIKELLEYTKK